MPPNGSLAAKVMLPTENGARGAVFSRAEPISGINPNQKGMSSSGKLPPPAGLGAPWSSKSWEPPPVDLPP